MKSETTLIGGSLLMLAIATFVLVVLPYLQLRHVEPAKGLKPYTSAQLRGRHVYIQQGCLYCHSQQPTVSTVAPDRARGWGRPAVPADYYYDDPHLLGGSRTGPDLFNIGARQPSADWHLGHLFQPRAYVPESIMPSFPYLFEMKHKPAPEDRVVALPPGVVPQGYSVIAKPAALDLVTYLQSLDHTYPVIEGTLPAR